MAFDIRTQVINRITKDFDEYLDEAAAQGDEAEISNDELARDFYRYMYHALNLNEGS